MSIHKNTRALYVVVWFELIANGNSNEYLYLVKILEGAFLARQNLGGSRSMFSWWVAVVQRLRLSSYKQVLFFRISTLQS